MKFLIQIWTNFLFVTESLDYLFTYLPELALRLLWLEKFNKYLNTSKFPDLDAISRTLTQPYDSRWVLSPRQGKVGQSSILSWNFLHFSFFQFTSIYSEILLSSSLNFYSIRLILEPNLLFSRRTIFLLRSS